MIRFSTTILTPTLPSCSVPAMVSGNTFHQAGKCRWVFFGQPGQIADRAMSATGAIERPPG